MDEKQLKDIFSYHMPITDQAVRYESLRYQAFCLSLKIQDFCPESREKALAITNLQQAIMWANAAIAINEKE